MKLKRHGSSLNHPKGNTGEDGGRDDKTNMSRDALFALVPRFAPESLNSLYMLCVPEHESKRIHIPKFLTFKGFFL